jgi:hypothetical protein
MLIAEREKIDYIIGDTPQLKKGDASYAKWYAENQKVKRWLLISMKPEIMKRYLRLGTAREIWIALAKAFYDGSDETQVFALNQRAFNTKQDGRPLSTYYGDLVEIFQELDHRDKVVMNDPDDVKTYRKTVERLRVHIFLHGLDAEFDQLRGEILRKDPSLDFEETYAYVRRDAMRRATLNGEPDQLESSAMVARRTNPHQGRTNPKSEQAPNSSNPVTDQTRSSNRSYEIGAARSERVCTHCGANGHTKARCYELIGFPEWWDPAKAPRKRNSRPNHHASVTVAETSADNPKATSSLVATSGNIGKALNISVPNSSSTWIIDSGATDHMTFDTHPIQSLKSSKQPVVSTANGTSSPVLGEGSIALTKNLNLNSVLVVPSLHYSLLSVAQITNSLQCIVIFWPNRCVFKDIRTRRTIGYGTRRGKLYYLNMEPAGSSQLAQAFSTEGSTKSDQARVWLWHRRLGHASFGYLKKLFPKLFLNLSSSDFKCDICELAKSHRVPFPIRMHKSPIPFMVVHSDVWGPAKIPSLNGSRWFVSFIDDYSRMTWVCLMKTKDEVSMLFKKFHKMVTTQYQSQIKVFRTDNGRELVNRDVDSFLNLHGMVHQTTCTSTPQQNGVAERKNRHLLEVVRASLFGACMPTRYWGDALTAAAYLINRVPSSTLEFETPCNVLHRALCAPTVSNLPPKIFGCVAFVHLPKALRHKLAPRALRCVFVGYGLHQKGYKCYHPPSRKEYVTLDVVFHETEMYYPTPKSPLQGESRDKFELETLNMEELEALNMEELEAQLEGQIDEEGQIDVEKDTLDPDQLEGSLSLPEPSVPHNQLLPQSDSAPESQVSSESSLPVSQINSESI